MTELAAALGLVLVLEGALYALFPDMMRRVADQVLSMPGDRLRLVGVISAMIGVFIVWLARA